jgi:GNAT superfamily N-acetyltransferase
LIEEPHLSDSCIELLNEVAFKMIMGFVKRKRNDLTAAKKLKEWPRSTALRQKSMQKAMNSMVWIAYELYLDCVQINITCQPPLALVLLDESGALLGHARLCPLPLENRACWVESVVVWRRLRGQGLGRVLMEKVEGWAREQQFTKVVISQVDDVWRSYFPSRSSSQLRTKWTSIKSAATPSASQC